ncbi:transporter substrate-binding domain-containing protein [Paenibacillus sp. PsM32]|uniref:Transporter substrate-binding domain-containing protein n=2 Tax=Paenibacillus TaxID=44249 RepID=A0AAX3M9S7_9BACL|nr:MULTISPECIES: transporter substrate-binding domain-containing protein [Paenibacillus]MDN4620053.1 transporter substrate-binding domain-containing protein [Paenibacillus sp. PsM32]WCT58138.1 transporter substrate-binding domain-containing protein [Paenibacillus kyungheensis]WDF53214.1 transporter substrate-binding domain-containing protein [Paenibacillus sp. KACC 21273]
MLVLSGCASVSESSGGSAGGTSSASDSNNATASTGGVKKIIVGTGTAFPNVCFIDENGKLTGYDVELVREIDKRLPDVEFEFKTMEFSNLLLSLETNKIDFVAHQMETNPEREQKYLFNKVPYSIFLNRVAVAKDNNAIKGLDDLVGKKVLTGATSNAAYLLNEYNKTHNNGIDVVYSSGAANDTVQQIVSGRVDATITTDFANRFNTDADGNVALKTVGEPLNQSNVFFVFRKDEQPLADEIDQAITEIKADGTLKKLSEQWLGDDFTKTLEEAKVTK